MTEQARFAIRLIDEVPVIDASGELDMTNVHGFEAFFAEAADANRGIVVVSLVKVTYFDSRTIHALGMLAARLAKNRQRLAVVLPSMPSARAIFQMSGLRAKLNVFDDIDTAMHFARANKTELR